MTRKLFYLSSIFVIALLSSCKNDDSDDPIEIIDVPARELSADEAEIVDNANNFTFDLMAEIEETVPGENYFISSFSVSTAISMVMNGASDATQDGFIEAIGLEGMTAQEINKSYKSLVDYIYGLDPSVTLNVANSNWYANRLTLNNDFANALSNYYDAEVFARDFSNSATLDDINGWVENATNGKIEEILESIDPDHVMFLINAIYFKATWTSQFDEDDTKNESFQLANNESVDVPTMIGEVKHWTSYYSELDARVIELPYGNENYGFTIIMPREASDIDGLVSRIDVDELNELLSDTTSSTNELHLPKFKLAFKTDLKNNLVNMGMPIAGLDNLFEEDLPLEISSVVHQSFLEVNEEGSEAAAATVIGIVPTSAPPVTRIDQPFVFLIRERNSGTILFSGKMVDPR